MLEHYLNIVCQEGTTPVTSKIQKFINPKFLNGIDLDLMQQLFTRHFADEPMPVDFGEAEDEVRAALAQYFEEPLRDWDRGLVGDLHRIADLGSEHAMQIVLEEARRQNVTLYPEQETGDATEAPMGREPKHVALHVYLNHHGIFKIAADLVALRGATSIAEFRGPARDLGADLTEASKAAFEAAMKKLLVRDLHGDYCRLGPYEDEGETNLVISHGTPETTTAIVSGKGEEIVPLSEVKYATLRYSAAEGVLRIGGVTKARQADVARIFAEHVLMRPDFFSGDDSRDLYTLDPIDQIGPDFAFEHRYNDRILKVDIVAASADLFEVDENTGKRKYVRSWEARNPRGGALADFRNSEVKFGRGWELGEIKIRVYFNTGKKRPAQVTVHLKPPGTLDFQRKTYEKEIHELIARNGLEKEQAERDHDDLVVVEAAQ